MLTKRNLIVLAAAVLAAMPVSAGSIVYVVTIAGQFGTIDPTTGAFTEIGPTTSGPLGGLVPGSNGYLGVSVSGNLDLINPATGAISVIGATGLGGLAFDTAKLNGTVYEADLSNNLYTINTTTGAATLIGYTGIPECPSLMDPNPDNDFGDEAFFAAGGTLYVTFDGVDPTTSTVLDAPTLYQINPTTGVATMVGPTALEIDGAVDVNSTVYAFTASNQVLSLDVANGATTFVTNYDPAANFVTGAAVVTPEPAFFTLVGIGIGLVLVSLQRRLRS